MGAQSFTHQIVASNAQEAFKMLVERAEEEYGTDSYNGTISTCQMGRCTKRFETPTKSNIEKAYEWIEKNDYGEKWVAQYIDLGIDHYEIYEAKKECKTPDVKYEMAYCIYPAFSTNRVAYKKTRKEAIDFAKQLALKDGDDYLVLKEYVAPKNQSALAATISISKTSVEKLPKRLERGKTSKAFHSYIFYGWASC